MSALEKLTAELAEARLQIQRLTDLLERQGAALAQLAGKAVPESTVTIAELYEQYARARRSDRSWKTINNRLLPLVRCLGHLRASELTPPVWAEHRGVRLLEPNKYKRLPKETLLNLELGRAKELLKFGVQARLLPSNPLADAKYASVVSGRETWLKETELQRLLGQCNATLRAFVILCADTGLRFNEARMLRREWIRPDGVVELPRRKTKSKRSRLVALTPRAREAVDALPRLLPDPLGRDEIFRDPKTGRLIPQSRLRDWFRAACEASGIDKCVAEGDGQMHIHDLRHTAAQAALRRGASISAVQRMLGHSSLQITQKYLHHDDAEILHVAKLMDVGSRAEVLS